MNFRKLLTYLTVGTAAVIPFAGAQNPTILQGSYISNVFGNSNFVLNPNAQTNIANVTTVTATVTRSTTTPLVATSEFTVAIGTANGTATWATRAFDAGMKGQNCEARFTYKGFAATSKVHIKQGANTVASLTLTPATDPRIASINFPCGDLSNPTTFVVTDTAILAGTNEIGGIYLGLATNMANVAQAEMVGGGEWTAASTFRRPATVTQATYTPFTSSTGNAGTALVIGKATSAATDTTITFPYLPAGEYQVVTNLSLLLLDQIQVGECKFSIQEIDSNTYNGQTFSGSFWTSGTIYTPSSMLVGRFNFTSGGQRRFRIVSLNTPAGLNSACAALTDTTSNKAGIYVYRFPSASELVVTPERQNTWGGARYYGGILSEQKFSGVASNTSNYVTVGTGSGAQNWATVRTLQGKAVAPTSSSQALGLRIPSLPVGNYMVTIRGDFAAAYPTSSAGWYSVCGFDIFETTTSASISNMNSIADSTPGTPLVFSTYKNGLRGVFNNTSLADREFVLRAAKTQDSTSGTLGICQIISSGANSGTPSEVSIDITPLDQPSNSALYVEGPVKAAATGAAIPAGYVGEVKQTLVTTAVNHTNSTWTEIASLTLTAGTWSVSGTASWQKATGVMTETNVACTLGPTTALVAANYSSGTNYRARSAGQIDANATSIDEFNLALRPMVVRSDGTNLIFADGTTVSSVQTMKVICFGGVFSSGQPVGLGSIEAVRLN